MPLYPAQFNGAAIAGNGTVGGNLTVTGSAIVGGVQVPSDTWEPTDHSLLAWSFDPISATSSATVTTGVVQLIEVILRQAATINNVIVQVAIAGSTLTSGQNLVGLYDSTGTRRGVSSDQTTNWGAAGTYTAALTAPYSAAAGKYWVAIVSNGTTSPAFARSTGIASTSTMVNVGLTAATTRFGTIGTGQTTLPATITPASIANAITSFWLAVS
ncbi:hypothetical protein [Streptomyces mirabilis]